MGKQFPMDSPSKKKTCSQYRRQIRQKVDGASCIKAFITFLTACENVKNSMCTIDFCENSPWGKNSPSIPHGEVLEFL